MVERQVRAWYGRLLEGTFAKLASARMEVEPPGKDMEDGWSCRAIRRLNEHLKAASSIPAALTRLKFPRVGWNEPLGLTECPYLHRWVLDFGAFALCLHRWHSSDDARAFHDHAWWFLTLVLWGSYVDVSPAGRDHPCDPLGQPARLRPDGSRI